MKRLCPNDLRHPLVWLLASLIFACAPGSGTESPPRPVLFDLVDEFEFAEQQDPGGARPRVDLEERSLYLPFGSSVSFYLDVAGASALAIDDVVSRSAPGSRLDVTLRRAYAAESADLGPLRPGEPPYELAIPEDSDSILRIDLRAQPGADAGSRGGLTLRQPRVVRVGPARETEPAAEAAAPAAGAARPNVILYLVDTLRADFLGTYGYDAPVSPNIDRFAAESLVFENAIAQSSWTKPSVASIITGLGPSSHNTNHREDALPDGALTLAEMFSASGYATAAYVANIYVGEEFNFQQGFDTFQVLRKGSRGLTRVALSDLKSGALEPPFFLYVHTTDPHSAYVPRKKFADRFASGVPGEMGTLAFLQEHEHGIDPEGLEKVVSLYENEIAFTDHHFGRFIAQLKELDLYDDAVIVFLSDHGEEFWDHGRWGHGNTLYSEVIRVPLILKTPSGASTARISEIVQLIDVFPTLLDYASIEIPGHVQGKSLRGLNGSAAFGKRPVFSHLDRVGQTGVSVILDRWKLILPESAKFGDAPELYEWQSDRDERVDQADRFPVVTGYLTSLAKKFQRESGAIDAEKVEISEEMARELRALGYLGDE